MYEDVRSMLLPGFLSEHAEVNGASIGFRTFNRADYFMLKNRSAKGLDDPKISDWAVASAVWMVDGQSLLEDPQAAWHIRNMCRDWPGVVRSDLMEILVVLRNRVEKATAYLEAFMYEDEARFLWRSYRTRLTEANGIPGASRLGLNHLQEMWIAYNEIEDIREQFQMQWTQAKLVASTASPKGIKKINVSDEAARKRIADERQLARDRAYYLFIGRPDLVPDKSTQYGALGEIRYARSPEELQDEYHRWRAGIKDDHDLVVDAYKTKIKRKVEAEREAQRERVLATQRALAAEDSKEPSLLPVLANIETLDQNWGHHTKVYSTPKRDRLYSRYLENEAKGGRIELRQGQPVSVTDAEPASTLQERVAARKPTVDDA